MTKVLCFIGNSKNLDIYLEVKVVGLIFELLKEESLLGCFLLPKNFCF